MPDFKVKLGSRLSPVLSTNAKNTTQVLGTAGLDPAFISETTADPPIGPDGTKGAKATTGGGLVHLKVVSGAWVPDGISLAGASETQQAQLSADSAKAALANSKAGLAGKGAADGPQLADGSRWLWVANGVAVDGGRAVAARDGVWVREYTGPLRAVWYGVVADGVTDDTTAMQAAINAATALHVPLELPCGTIITTRELISTDTLILNGQYSNVGMFEWAAPLKIARTEIRRIVRGAAEQAVLRVRGAGSYISFVQFTASQLGADGFGPIKYDTARLDMVDLSQSSDYGVVFEGTARGATMYRCEVAQAAKRGFVLGQVYNAAASADGRLSPRAVANDQGNVMRLDNVMVASCGAGGTVNATDSKVVSSYLHHNAGEGLLCTAAFPHVSGNRSEWNAKQGYILRAAEFDFVNNLADRNGWSGLWIDSNWRGQVVGNSLSRNGAGGDGQTGRWGFSTPGTPSYLLTPEEECCQIRLKYMRGVTLTGNSYRAGLSDGNDGVLSPARIYYGDNVADCTAVGNAGEFPYVGGSGGFTTAHRLYSGAVEALTNFSAKSLRLQPGVNDATEVGYGVDVGPIDSLDIALPAEFFGTVTVMGGKFQSSVCCVVDVIRRADAAFGQTTVRVNSGSLVPTVTAIPAGIRLAMPAGTQVYLRYRAAQML